MSRPEQFMPRHAQGRSEVPPERGKTGRVQAKSGRGPEATPERCQLLTVRDVAAMLAVSVRTVWRLSATGALPRPLRLGTKTLRWRLSDVRAYLADVEKSAMG